MKLWLACLMLLVSLQIFAQDNTMGEKKEEPRRDTLFYPDINSKLLIFPFEPKLYRSEIDQEVGPANGLNFQELRGFYRLGLDNALYLAAKEQYDVIRFHADDAEINKDLYFVYKSMGYQNRDLPPVEDENEGKISKTYNKLVSKVSKAEEEPEPGTRMDHGQLVNNPNSQSQFMVRTIVNENVLDYCEEKYMAGLFLFINQLDLLHAPGVDWTQYSNDDYPRIIRVHYTIFNKSSQEGFSGLASTTFSSQTNDIREIISKHFTEVAAQIINKVPLIVVQQTEDLLAE